MFRLSRSPRNPEDPESYFVDRAAIGAYARLWDSITLMDEQRGATSSIFRSYGDRALIRADLSDPPAQCDGNAVPAYPTTVELESTMVAPYQITLSAENGPLDRATGNVFFQVTLTKRTPRGAFAQFELTPTTILRTIGTRQERRKRMGEDTLRQLKIDVDTQTWRAPISQQSRLLMID